MRLVAKKIADRILFYKLRAARWAEQAAAIGLSPEETATLAARVDAAVAAMQEQHAARQRARSKTLALHMAAEALGEYGSSLIRKIKAKAGEDGNDVYGKAWIRPPDAPSPIAPPGKPYDFDLTLQQIGVMELTWKCDNPRGAVGTIYQLWRQLDGNGPFQYIGATGAKRFLDATLPAGTAHVTYQVQAMRSTKVGPAAQYTINIGVSGAGLPHAMRFSGSTKKATLAA